MIVSSEPEPHRATLVGGPWFEDLAVGQRSSDAPALTVTAGHAAVHQTIVGERFRLALDAGLCRTVTGRSEPLVTPSLVCNVAIGQSTWASQRVRANLFYRQLVLLRPVHVGDTLSTTTEVVALKQNRAQPGRPATGLAVLRVTTVNQDGEEVLDFWRCPMIPLRDPSVETGHVDSVEVVEAGLDPERVEAAVPADWRLDELRHRTSCSAADHPAVGSVYELEPADVVTSAPELARMTLNLAAAHYDPLASPYGRRLVYGGHTISVAAAQVTRLFPDLVTIVAWRRCDHTGPVFEGDHLRSRVSVGGWQPLRDGFGLADLHVTTTARGDGREERPVLDWQLVALL
ncbi:MAG TPA: MaoC family dehydratase [Mycobacteriales bacterium]|nr:MaoC family dehydratase [Mycobacteriales bacterium]